MKAKLTDLHEALKLASLEPRHQEAATEVAGTRLRPSVKSALDRICELNGTSASAYLRQCAEKLVDDYGRGES